VKPNLSSVLQDIINRVRCDDQYEILPSNGSLTALKYQDEIVPPSHGELLYQVLLENY
jgi:hypothetical protein